MKTVLAPNAPWPTFEPWEPERRDTIGRLIPPRKPRVRKPPAKFTGISYENQVEKLMLKLRGATNDTKVL